MASGNDTAGALSVRTSAAASSTNPVTEDPPYHLLSQSTGTASAWTGGLSKEAPSSVNGPDDIFTPSQYTWNLILGITASVIFVLVTVAALFGLIAFKRYMRKRNRTLSADTGVFSPRRGSKAGLDMIDNSVVLTSHSSLQRSGSLRKQFQKLLSR
ncbi:uncharacterized protein LOC110982320 [Acanthaster planci]|uniref:Uncharacterized protein LOC110982320 n=1 Tax=Acanthaster planci TaxID=133434 RepID=A0A8B7YUH1_ACAPL|nr:uncharacterized protein LOC110982320 [Acanthaster planci]